MEQKPTETDDCGTKRCRDLGCFGYCDRAKAHNAAATLADDRLVIIAPNRKPVIVGRG